MKKPAQTEYKLIEPILERWSPRAFDEQREVSEELLKELVEAARWAPSCFNEQPWRFLIFGREDHYRKDVEAALVEGNVWAKKASHLFVITAKQFFKQNGKPNRHHIYDAGAATLSMVLQAEAEGIITHQMAGFKEDELRESLDVPDDVTIIAVMALGYEEEDKTHAGLNEKQLQQEKGPRQRLAYEEIATSGTKWNF